jgi:hypothetical protein
MLHATRSIVSVACRSVGFIRAARLGVAGLVLGMASLPGASAPAAAPVAAAEQPRMTIASSSLRPEVRLRKLHLVRPDLIGYPLAYDIYC